MMKGTIIYILVIIAVLGLLAPPVLAQRKATENLEVYRKRIPKSDILEKIQRTQEHTNGVSFGMGMHMTFLQNPVFGERISNGTLSHDLTFSSAFSSFGIRTIALPFIIDQTIFSSVPFVYEEGIEVEEESVTHFRHRGMSVSLSLAAFNFSKIIYPYLGLGYSLSSLGSGKYYSAGYNVVLHTSAPIWKVGIAIHPSRKVIVTAEYSASVSNIGDLEIGYGPSRAFGTAEFSLRYQIAKFHKRR